MTDPDIRNNGLGKRDELALGVRWDLQPHRIQLDDHRDPRSPEPDGRGVASRMARQVIADARARDLDILLAGSFFSVYLPKHLEQTDAVHRTYPRNPGDLIRVAGRAWEAGRHKIV